MYAAESRKAEKNTTRRAGVQKEARKDRLQIQALAQPRRTTAQTAAARLARRSLSSGIPDPSPVTSPL